MPAPRHVLITGCSSGLGLATALYLQARDFQVHTTARTDADIAELTRLDLDPIPLDLNASDSIDSAVRALLDRTDGRLGALINNAGYSQLGAVEDITRDDLRAQFETNVFGTLELTNRLLPTLLEQDAATVVFISSVCARVAVPYLGSYSASKAALEALVDALRRETRDSPVRVHLLEPGIFNTSCFAATSRHFDETNTSPESRHADQCRRTLAQFKQELATIPASRNVLVAEAVHAFLTGKCRTARRIVPGRARVYEIARRFLPDRWLDAAMTRRRGGH